MDRWVRTAWNACWVGLGASAVLVAQALVSPPAAAPGYVADPAAAPAVDPAPVLAPPPARRPSMAPAAQLPPSDPPTSSLSRLPANERCSAIARLTTRSCG